MTPFPPEVTSAVADMPVGMIFRFTELAPAAAVVLLIAVLAAVGGLVRFDLSSHMLWPR